MAYHLEVYKQSGTLRRWRWRRVAGNGRISVTVQGQTPFVLEPGRYVVTMLVGEPPFEGHEGDNAVIAQQTGPNIGELRAYTVRTRYSPRWTQ